MERAKKPTSILFPDDYFVLFSTKTQIKSQSITLELKRIEYCHPTSGAGDWVDVADEGATPIPPVAGKWPVLALKMFSYASKTKAWSQSEGQKPVAYVSGCAPRIIATFKREKLGILSGCNTTNPRIWVRAKWITNGPPGGAPPILIDPIEITGIGSEISLGPIAFKDPFEKDKVVFRPNFEIKWEYAFAKDALNWETAGTSNHPLYVTHRKPTTSIASTGPATFFYSTLHHGCQFANGHSDISSIVGLTYTGFEDQQVERVGGSSGMSYWGGYSYSSSYIQAEWQFLFNLDGRCGVWGPFLGSMMALHGIKQNAPSPGATTEYSSYKSVVTAYDYHGGIGYIPANVADMMFDKIEEYFGDEFDRANPYSSSMPVSIYRDAGNSVGYFFVKNWNFSSGENDLYLLAPTSSSLTSPTVLTINGADEIGLTAQGPSANPKSYFENHCVMAYDEFIYDPSYGSSIKEVFNNNQSPKLG
ncbi:MAG: hypothetical protein IPH31_16970 [Lewinellaceae bacterium]|nr:hypothetical protein [Lewinellaceae bacterium]